MIIELKGAGFVNKGAELMLNATISKLRENGITNIATHIREGSFQQRNSLELKHLIWADSQSYPHVGDLIGKFGNLLPLNVTNRTNYVRERDINAVIDISGFKYSDQFGSKPTESMALQTKRWKKEGKKIILMPQAFGPFNLSETKKAMSEIIKNVDLIYARDKTSFEHLINLPNCYDFKNKIKQSPDFTNLIKGSVPDSFDSYNMRACIIPNYRMIDKTSEVVRSLYVDFLVDCVNYLNEKNKKPFILIHESDKDKEIAEQIKVRIDGEINILTEENPLNIKGILGQCELVIGSRFHGLVSSLSQSVPTMGTGWSHKYNHLFEDYEVSNFLISDFKNKEYITKLDILIQDETSKKVINKLVMSSEKQKQMASKMWEDIFKVLNITDNAKENVPV